MQNTTLPPQAFTKEMLSEAFEWLSRQPDGVKSQVKTTEGMMSLYLRHKRHGKHGSVSESVSHEPPASIRHFQSDLKNLAEGLRQFEVAESEPTMPTPGPTPEPSAPPSPSVSPAPQQPPATAAPVTPPKQTVAPMTRPQQHPLQDPKVRSLVLWTQERFNLSSESEALRVLVTIGQEQIEKLFPR